MLVIALIVISASYAFFLGLDLHGPSCFVNLT